MSAENVDNILQNIYKIFGACGDIVKIIVKGGFEIGGKLGLIAGICSGIAYNIFYSNINNIFTNILAGASSGISLGTFTGAFLINKKITLMLTATTFFISSIAYKVLF